MAVNMGKMRKGYQSQQRGGDFWTPPEGETLVYIHPPCRLEDSHEPTEGLNYIPVTVHYNVGKKNSMVVSLDSEINPVIKHPFVRAFLKKKKTKISGACPMQEAFESDELDDDEADEMRGQTRYLWGLTPLKYRREKTDEWQKLTPKPSVALVGKTIYDGIMELFFDNGDITEAKGAILAKIHREGKGKTDTKYKVTAEGATIKKPLKLPSALVKALKKAMADGGDVDLFKVVANLIKSTGDVKALLSGVKLDEPDDDDDDIEDDDDDADDDAEDDDAEDDDDDDADDDDDDDADDDIEDDDADDDDDDADDDADDDDDDAEDDDADADDDAEDDDAEDDDEDDDDELPAPKAKAKAKAKTKTKTKTKGNGRGDDLGLDELDEELSRIAKGKKSGTKAKAKEKPAKAKAKAKTKAKAKARTSA